MVYMDSRKATSRYRPNTVAWDLSQGPEINVCIVTYKRPISLRKLLKSLGNQQTEGRFTYNIIIVDNDVAGSSSAIVKEFEAGGHDIVYEIEPVQNICLARNRCLSQAGGDFIATIDDDERAEPDWLLNIYKTMITYEADVVMGPAVRIFPENTPEYIQRNPCFNALNPPTGATEKFIYSTANCLIRGELLQTMETPFNPDFGLTGGDDSVLFEQLKRGKCKFVWCREAPVYETINASRANILWLLRRMFRNGCVTHQMLKRGLVCDDHPSLREIRRVSIQKLPIDCAGVLISLVKSFVKSEYLSDAIIKTQNLSFSLGFLVSHLNIKYEEYR